MSMIDLSTRICDTMRVLKSSSRLTDAQRTELVERLLAQEDELQRARGMQEGRRARQRMITLCRRLQERAASGYAR